MSIVELLATNAPPGPLGLRELARRLRAGEIPEELAEAFAGKLEAALAHVSFSSATALGALRRGQDAAVALRSVRVPPAPIFDLAVVSAWLAASAGALIATAEAGRAETLRRFGGETIDSTIDMIGHALEAFVAAGRVFLRVAAQREGDARAALSNGAFVSRCLFRQSLVLVALDVIDAINARGSMEDHALALPIAKELVAIGTEHFEDVRRALGVQPTEPDFSLEVVPAAEPFTVDAHDREVLEGYMKRLSDDT